jgi:hypothetical protein
MPLLSVSTNNLEHLDTSEKSPETMVIKYARYVNVKIHCLDQFTIGEPANNVTAPSMRCGHHQLETQKELNGFPSTWQNGGSISGISR